MKVKPGLGLWRRSRLNYSVLFFTKVARQQRWRYMTPLIAPKGHRTGQDSQLTFCPLYLHLSWNHTWCVRLCELRSYTLHKSREILFFLWEALSDWSERRSGRGQCVKVGRAWLVWGIAGKSCSLSCEAYKDTQTVDNSQNEGPSTVHRGQHLSQVRTNKELHKLLTKYEMFWPEQTLFLFCPPQWQTFFFLSSRAACDSLKVPTIHTSSVQSCGSFSGNSGHTLQMCGRGTLTVMSRQLLAFRKCRHTCNVNAWHVKGLNVFHVWTNCTWEKAPLVSWSSLNTCR